VVRDSAFVCENSFPYMRFYVLYTTLFNFLYK
jgi:hypothetical protein